MVDAAGMPRCTPDDPPQGQPDAARRPVPLYGSDRVRTTGGVEAAPRGKSRTDRIAIPPQPSQQAAGNPAGPGTRAIGRGGSHQRCGHLRWAMRGGLIGAGTASLADRCRAGGAAPLEAGLDRPARCSARPNARSRALPSSTLVRPATAGSARTTTPVPYGRLRYRSRNRWRSCRVTRWRVTASPTPRLTMKPTEVQSMPR